MKNWLLVLTVVLVSCRKQTATIHTAALHEYLPLQTGKYIHYRLDSMRFINHGQKDTVVSYDAKDVVEAEVTGNAEKPAFRVVRYLRDIFSTHESDYAVNMAYLVSPTRECIEVMEQNLRFQKLRLPVTEGFSWHGNSYLPSIPFYVFYHFSNDEDMGMWNFTYQDVNMPADIGEKTYDSTVTVAQVADSANVPIDYPDGLAYKNYWIEKYAKNIGLIYKEVIMWEYQPPSISMPGYYSGFGLKMTIIDHN
jgi:hypothetical protein